MSAAASAACRDLPPGRWPGHGEAEARRHLAALAARGWTWDFVRGLAVDAGDDADRTAPLWFALGHDARSRARETGGET